MFYRWWNRYQAEGNRWPKRKSQRSTKGFQMIEDSLKKKVIKLRERYEWGPKKIAGCLRLKGYDIDNNQAYRIICQAGLNHPIYCRLERPGEPSVSKENIATVSGKLILSCAMTIFG